MDDFLQNLPHIGQTDIRLFAAAVNATSNGVVITDHSQPDEPIIYCNEAFERLTGYTKQEIIGHNCRFLQDDDRDQKERQQLKEAIQTGSYCQVEIRNYKKDGRLFWNELIVSPVKDQEGNVTHFIGVQNDITRRKEAESALRQERDNLEARVEERTHDLKESEIYLESIVETIRESLLVLDSDLKILSVNDHFCRFFKVSEKEITGKVITEMGEGRWNIPELVNLLKNVLPHNNPFENFELGYDFPSIGNKLLVLNARQVTHKGKYQDRILLAIEDITERRAIEQRKEDFISIASHEMKTPLTSIKGNIQLLHRKAVNSGDTSFLAGFETTQKSIIRLEKLITDLLDVAKIQSGKIEFKFTDFKFGDLLNEAVEAVQVTSPNHQIIITGNTDQNITADYGRLEQVLINLLSNAVKYSPGANKVGVHVALVHQYLKVAITDYGVGINRQEHKKIFERFYRADKITKKYPGVGIGLYVSNQIIQEHKGTLWVESEEGAGSVFNFTIPVNPQADEQQSADM
jgi:PAS domain S-box-containing protein